MFFTTLYCAEVKKILRTVPSRRENKNVPPVPSKRKSNVSSGRGRNYLPSRPVVKNYMHRPVPSRQFLFTVPSRRDIFYLPFRPAEKIKFTPTVPSRPIQETIFFIILPSRPVPSSFFFPPNMSKQYRPVPSRVLQAMNCLENCNTLVNMIGTMGLWA